MRLFARFNTKFVENEKYNGEIVEILEVYRGTTDFETRYKIKLKNGKIIDNVYSTELENI